ncbi:hypothetical protein B296_00006940 [Ensete ventricosum]|uniref:Uncharacterized protein n=1 Tax=Ensete ventricosum TaxID=4639 RepID=A0A427B2M9_ENSVE|nr:hypothetical protein B296_00006940 [Ensete ventricosum]
MLLESTRLAAFGRCVMGPTPVYPFARQNLRQPFRSMSPGVGVAHMEDPKPPISSADERGGDGIVARFADLCKVCFVLSSLMFFSPSFFGLYSAFCVCNLNW